MLLIVLNVPLIGIWVQVLQVPYRYLFPSAMFFIAVGVYSTNNSLFEIGEVLVFGVVGATARAFEFPVAPILLGFVLGPMVEENFRRALLLSRGDAGVHPAPDQRRLHRRQRTVGSGAGRFLFPRDSGQAWRAGSYLSSDTNSRRPFEYP